ncbi:hypothetical protein [Streptomyces kronopolitis]|uniref:hypothetical protein n=1 Tax=Streptomyces kronopolitis TaxID=1612435 RepID=UPI003D98A291
MTTTRSLTAAVLAVAAVGVAHTALAERRGRIDAAFASENLRQRLALVEAQDTEDQDHRAVLIGNSWLSSVAVRYRARLIHREGLADVARRFMTNRAEVWEQVRGPRSGEERDRYDRRFNATFEQASRRRNHQAEAA